MRSLPYKDLKPAEIEKKSMELIDLELEKMGIRLEGDTSPIIKRAIHTTADFDYAYNLTFSEGAVSRFKEAIRQGTCIVSDTRMAWSGINKNRLAGFGGEALCFMSDT